MLLKFSTSTVLFFSGYSTSMYVETFSEEVETVLIKSVVMLLGILVRLGFAFVDRYSD